jgi:hypothetical protein
MICNVLGEPLNATGPLLVVLVAFIAGFVLLAVTSGEPPKRRKK